MTNSQISNKQIIINDLIVNYYYFLPYKKSFKTLVFLHGWGVDSQLWFKIIPGLKDKNYSLYLLDLPGFGRSQVPDAAYNVDDYKKIIYGFVKKLGLKNINLIGHSFGGRIAIKMAAENSDILNKIILVNAAGIVNASKAKKIYTILAKVISPVFKLGFMKPFRKKMYFLLRSEYLENEKLSKTFSKVVSENLTGLMARINKPVLIIWGKNDLITPLYDGQLMNKLIPKSKLVIFKKAEHFSFLDQSGEFVKALTDFL